MAILHRHVWSKGLGAATLMLLLGARGASAYDWLQFGGDPQHSGRNVAETILTPANIATAALKYQVTLPATVDGAPVFLENISTPGGLKDLLFVTTTDGRIVAVDAQNGAVVWAHQNGPNGCTIINNGGGVCYTTSSPAIDPNRLHVYSYGLDGYVHKYQVGDGNEILTGGWPQLATLKGYDEKGSSALTIATSGGVKYLYAAHAGYPGDQGDYQGHVTAINLGTGAQKVFNTACSDKTVHLDHFVAPPETTTTCATRQNAIWARPGVFYDAGTDRIFVATGNAFTAGVGRFDGIHNWSESVLALHRAVR
jgi:glucose dehydrogenase